MLVWDRFTGGLNTYKDADSLSRDEATQALDCIVGTGSLNPRPALGAGAPSGECNELALELNNAGISAVTLDGNVYVSGDGAPHICGGRDLGLDKPEFDNFIVTQINTPDVIGPSTDGKNDNFTSTGDWVTSSFEQTNTYTVIDTTDGSTTTYTDTWTICDTPPFNITEYYSLKEGLAYLKHPPPARDQYGCPISGVGSSLSDIRTMSEPLDQRANPQYLEDPTFWAVSWWNEDLQEESTISQVYEFKPVPVIKRASWRMGPLAGHIEPLGPFPTDTLPPLETRRGDVYQTLTYEGISYLHQVQIEVKGMPAAATHAIVYQRIDGEFIPVAKLERGGSITVTAQTDYDDPDLRDHVAQLTEFKAPPSDLEGLTVSESGVFAGFVGNKVYLSNPFGPDLWSKDFEYKLPWTVRSVTPFFSEFFITTNGHPVRLVGELPDEMSIIEMPDNEVNLNGASTFKLGRMVAWAGPEGVSVFNGSTSEVVTRGSLSKADWDAIKDQSDSFVGTGTEEVYLLFYTGGCLMLDMRPESAAITKLSTQATAAVYSITENLIYLNGGRTLSLSEPIPSTKGTIEGKWVSGRINTNQRGPGITVGRVLADGPVTVRLRNEKGHEFKTTADGYSAFRVGYDGDPFFGFWIEMEVRFQYKVRRVEFAPTFEALKEMSDG